MTDFEIDPLQFVVVDGPAGTKILTTPDGELHPRSDLARIPSLVQEARQQYLAAKEERDRMMEEARDSLNQYRAFQAGLESSDELVELQIRRDELSTQLMEVNSQIQRVESTNRRLIAERRRAHQDVLSQKSDAATACDRAWRRYRALDALTKPARDSLSFEQFRRD